ncbi:AAA family ATPase [Vibrio sp. SCSIO 43135]|uniref:AAA family ATPase n=1 Tax=Vibrio sp. SCSIO 43135 TaxID=2819096 RepID=UPI002075D22B|nr:ABC transporter transmembrane domain-containing protein [Vibrio sp. SCSIO 43135]USD42308.1 AAA family ATPase [Vibrio sp. SCSIO 43135]
MRSNTLKNNQVVAKVLLPSLLINLLSLAVPLTVLQIYDRILPNQSYGTATLLLIGAAVAVGLEALIRFVRSWILSAAANNTENMTYQRLIEKIGCAEPSQLRHAGVGGVEEGLGSVSRVKEWYSGGIIAGFIDLPFAIIFLALVAYIGGELVLVPVAVWLATLAIVWISSQKAKSLGEQASRYEQDRKGFLLLLSQTLQGIKRQAVESRIFSQFKRLNYSRSLSKAREEEQNAFAQECIQLAALATSVTLVIVGSLWVLAGDLTTGGLAACSILSGRAVAPLSALIGVRVKLNTIHTANQAIEKLEHLSENHLVPQLAQSLETLTVNNLVGERYGNLCDVGFTASKGDLVLLSSDARHVDSYVLALLAGIDEPSSIEVQINEQVSSQQNLRSEMAYCGAKGQLVAGTLLDNLCGFNPENTERANQYSFGLGLSAQITRLPDGLETKIGHTPSSPLSMGSIKLLNIAAQLATSKTVVLLDKPDASLDLDSLAKLAQVLEQEKANGRIIIIVTHHPSLQQLATKTVTVESNIEKGEAA